MKIEWRLRGRKRTFVPAKPNGQNRPISAIHFCPYFLGFSMHPSEEIFTDAIRQCRDLLTDSEYQEAFEFSDRHGEYGLAIETLADILIEKNVKLNESQLKAISEAFAFMHLDDHGGRLESLRGD